MILSFESETIRAICEDDDAALQEFDVQTVETLQRILADLEAFSNLEESKSLIDYISIDEGRKFKILVTDEIELVLVPIQPTSRIESAFLKNVNRIKIIKIGKS